MKQTVKLLVNGLKLIAERVHPCSKDFLVVGTVPTVPSALTWSAERKMRVRVLCALVGLTLLHALTTATAMLVFSAKFQVNIPTCPSVKPSEPLTKDALTPNSASTICTAGMQTLKVPPSSRIQRCHPSSACPCTHRERIITTGGIQKT
jgi:hypothetical protein